MLLTRTGSNDRDEQVTTEVICQSKGQLQSETRWACMKHASTAPVFSMLSSADGRGTPASHRPHSFAPFLHDGTGLAPDNSSQTAVSGPALRDVRGSVARKNTAAGAGEQSSEEPQEGVKECAFPANGSPESILSPPLLRHQ